jgi:hypothetical protein
MFMSGFEDTPWFDSLRLIRQSIPGEWEDVFDRAAERLREFMSTGTLWTVEPEMSYRTVFAMVK